MDTVIKSTAITTPKREASVRTIPMTDGVMKAFRRIKAQQEGDKDKNLLWGTENPLLEQYPDLVMTTKKGNCFLPGYLQGESRRLMQILNKREEEKAKAENRTFESSHVCPHMFRHTFTTNCYEQKIDQRVLRDIVGHASGKMTQHYTHPGDNFVHAEFQKYANEMNANEK